MMYIAEVGVLGNQISDHQPMLKEQGGESFFNNLGQDYEGLYSSYFSVCYC